MERKKNFAMSLKLLSFLSNRPNAASMIFVNGKTDVNQPINPKNRSKARHCKQHWRITCWPVLWIQIRWILNYIISLADPDPYGTIIKDSEEF
jgi:hypothetical protein